MPAESRILKQFKPVKKELAQVQRFIDKQLAVSPKANAAGGLIGLLKDDSGKMIRPALLLLSGRYCGKITAEHIKAAAIVEMLHNATLLHDDVIDDGRIRRGRPTVNRLCGNATAILLGDFLLSRIFILCNTIEPEISEIIAAATSRLCMGEITQTAQRRNWNLTEREYLRIITDKTAHLFSSCCLIGAILAGADKNARRRFADFGLNFGIAFQIADDLADLVDSENKTGKTTGSDLDRCNPTLALIHHLGTLNHKQRNELVKRLYPPPVSRKGCPTARDGLRHSADLRRIQKQVLRKLLDSSGSIEYTQSRVNFYIDKAIQSLGNLNQTPTSDVLIQTARFLDTD